MNKKLIILGLIIGLTGCTAKQAPQATNGLTNTNMPDSNASSNQAQSPSFKMETLQQGTGEVAQNGDHVTVHYVGTLTNGTKFDSSRDRGTPFEFDLGLRQVIQGWDMGVLGMKVGELKKLIIPAELAYGASQRGIIPPNSTLVFEVELLKIEKPKQ